MTKPIAVLTSDVHYELQNLAIADKALNMAIDKANELEVPLIIAGDLHHTKAAIRAECIRALKKTLRRCVILPYITRGNHCSDNEKSENHALDFLDDVADIISVSTEIGGLCHLIPYYHNPDELHSYLKTLPKDLPLIMHQGIIGSNMGDYIQDKSAITSNDVSGFRVVSGHYHSRQTIQLPNGGVWDYIGSPYTTSYGEANDPPKGFQILMDDGSLEFVPTNLRRHIIIDIYTQTLDSFMGDMIIGEGHINSDDLLWVKVRGTKEELRGVTKDKVTTALNLNMDIRLDLIPTNSDSIITKNVTTLSKIELLDSLIDSLTNTSEERKSRLKDLWKSL